MIKLSSLIKKRFLGAFLCVILVILGVYEVFKPVPVGATNNYVDNITLTTENILGRVYLKLTFHVKTTFYEDYLVDSWYFSENQKELGYYQFWASKTYLCAGYPQCSTYYPEKWLLPEFLVNKTTGYISSITNYSEFIGNVCKNNKPCYRYTYLAGNTYSFYIQVGVADFTSKQFGSDRCGYFLEYNLDCLQNATFKLIRVGNNITLDEPVELTLFPELNITYPVNENEIAGAFTIQGTYSVPESYFSPEPNKETLLITYFGDAYGRTEPNGLPYPYYAFSQKLATTTGDVNIPIDGVLEGAYLLYFRVVGNFKQYVVPGFITIYLVNDIPPVIGGEGETTPPTIPVFTYQDFESYYATHSDYATPTPVVVNLANSISPLLDSLGNNLVNFANEFTQTKATERASSTATAIMTARTYANSLNSFFNNLPISQLLITYLLVLLVVGVFRLGRNVLGLFKI